MDETRTRAYCRVHRWLNAAVAVLASSAAAFAEPVACAETRATVDADAPGLALRVCSAVARTEAFLSACGIGVSDPVRIRVGAEIISDMDDCAGLYISETREIRARTPEGMAERRARADPEMVVDEMLFFESVIAHEWAHAAFDQTASERAQCTENHEYVGYLAQMWYLPEPVREKFLGRFPERTDIGADELNLFIAGLAPDLYAAKVWQHFQQDEGGCGFLRDLAAGRQTLQLFPE